MLKNRKILSCTRLSKKNIKAHCEAPSQPKLSRVSVQINSIITSLERNVKDLKTYYRQRQSFKATPSSLPKNKSAFRLKKVLHRNGSQTNLTRPHSHTDKHSKQQDVLHSDSKDKNSSDVFEVGKCFLKMYGRETTNIVELYQFYKKNLEKKDKSTRILASMDMSNPHMGLSLQVGKESMFRPDPQHESHKESLKLQQRLAEEKIITQKLQSDNKQSNSSKLDQTGNTHKSSRPSHLANDLMSKGLYNIANVANLMISKKYKLTKQKQESFQRAKLQRQKVSSVKIELQKQNNQRLSNTGTLKGFPSLQDSIMTDERASSKIEIPQKKIAILNSNEKSNSNVLDLNASFQQTTKQQLLQGQLNPNQQESKIIQKKQNIADVEEFQVSSIKKINQDRVQIDQLSGLEESPIVPQKLKPFQTSKYYVQPIPDKRRIQVLEEKSMTLKSNSRIIDIDLLPFDL